MDVVEQGGSVEARLTNGAAGRTPQMGGRKIRHFRDGPSGALPAVFVTQHSVESDGD
jgi:hypothetical protein